jgi:hypothetical protein
MWLQFRQHHAVKQCRKMYVKFPVMDQRAHTFPIRPYDSPCLSLPVYFLSCAHPSGPIRVTTPTLVLDIMQEQQ